MHMHLDYHTLLHHNICHTPYKWQHVSEVTVLKALHCQFYGVSAQCPVPSDVGRWQM